MHQVAQSVGQFLTVFVTGMLIYKGWSEVVSVGVLNAIYQPVLQGILSTLVILGFSKVQFGKKEE